jgi:serine/threonine protein kinase
MPAPDPPRGILLDLAAQGLIPVLGGCAGALAGGPEGGIAGVAVGQVVEKAINFFGARIVRTWYDWLRGQPVEVREAAFSELAALSQQEAKQQAEAAIDRLAPDASAEDKSVAVEYLASIPRALDKALPLERADGKRELPPTVTFLEQPLDLLPLLPADAPPYPVPSDLPGTPYRLEKVLGSGGFGTVYKASAATLQHLPLAIKFCLDPNLTAALHQERSLLERLLKAGNEPGAHRVVRLYGYDLDHRTPYLVYEFVSGGDLLRHVARLRRQKGRPLDAAEVRALIVQVVEGLAFAHRHGLVHRDLKPANILLAPAFGGGDAAPRPEAGANWVLKLADFGLGSVVAARVARMSQLGGSTVNHLTAAQQLSLFRGAGTPLYMSPEQRNGAAADPRHDLYSLGVMWYQLLVGDTRRELHPGWAKELAVKFQTPREQIDLIERCVGWFEERPRDAGELLQLLQEGEKKPAAVPAPSPEQAPPPAGTKADAGSPEQGYRRERLLSLLRQVQKVHATKARGDRPVSRLLKATLFALLTGGGVLLLFYLVYWLTF